MSDRADEVAQEFVPTNATKIMVDTRSGDRQVYSADEWREHIAATLRAYAEEAVAHWKRETDTGAMMLAAIHGGLGLLKDHQGGISAQDVLDYFAMAVEEARREEIGKCPHHTP